MKRVVLLVVAALLSVSAAYSADLNTLISGAGLQALKPGTHTIDFRLNNLNGDAVSLSSLEGKVVLLNFWATWCGPCRSEMGSLESLYKKYRDQGFVVVGVNLQESPSDVKAFVEKFGLTFPILLDRSGRVGVTYGARGIPTTYLISKTGEVTSGVIGAHEWATQQMYDLVQALLKEK